MNTVEARRTRRGILKGGAAAAALVGVSAAMRGRAEAATGDPIRLGKVSDAGVMPTTVNAAVDGPDAAFSFNNQGNQSPALVASAEVGTPGGTTPPLGTLVGYTQNGWGVVGSAAGDTADGIGVVGIAQGKATGVRGWSEGGRGGLFSGRRAQIRLLPAGAATHPKAGASGDLFVDATGRLWYCTTGGNPASWKQLA
jgi:hypothetical protein